MGVDRCERREPFDFGGCNIIWIILIGILIFCPEIFEGRHDGCGCHHGGFEGLFGGNIIWIIILIIIVFPCLGLDFGCHR